MIRSGEICFQYQSTPRLELVFFQIQGKFKKFKTKIDI